jgi:transcriptional regulator with XRE-family HTH domain
VPAAWTISQFKPQKYRDVSIPRKDSRVQDVRMAPQPAEDLDDEEVLDALTIGRRIRSLRTDRGLTLEALAAELGRAPSQVSVIENGKRELKIGELQKLARILGVSLDELLSAEPPSKRAALEIQLERVQRGPLYASLGLPAVPARKTLSDDAIEAILGLHDELRRLHEERAATPEEARRANVDLRAEQRKKGNHFEDLETIARDLLAAVGHQGGPLSQRIAADLASHLGFTLHYVGDLPETTRSVTDHANGRIYLPVRQSAGGDPRSALLQALAAHVLGKQEPKDYADLLRQRVETNYLAGALLIPEASAVSFLQGAKEARELSVEDLRDAFAVTTRPPPTGSPTSRRGTSASRCTSSRCTRAGRSRRPTRTTGRSSPPTCSAPSKGRSSAATGARGRCSPSKTASARTTSTPTSRRAPTGAPRASRAPRRGRSR